MNAASYSLEHASDLKIPTLIIHGSDDLITSPEGSREFAEKSEKATLRIWEGGYHELHNEPFKDEVFNYIMDWINVRLIAIGFNSRSDISRLNSEIKLWN